MRRNHDLDSKHIKDKKHLDTNKDLCKDLIIFKPDKGNGIVLIRTSDYYGTIEKLL